MKKTMSHITKKYLLCILAIVFSQPALHRREKQFKKPGNYRCKFCKCRSHFFLYCHGYLQ